MLLDGYDDLKEPKYITPGWDYYCFTNDRGLKSENWQIVQVPKVADVKRQSRHFKCIPHFQAAQTIYIDATREICGDLELFAASKRRGLWLEPHPYRNCLYKEAQTVMDKGLDDPAIVAAQIARYRAEGYPPNTGLYRGGVIVRNGDCTDFSACWANEIKNGSHRDQISLPYSLWKTKQAPNRILSSIVDQHFRLYLHKPKVLTGGLTRVTDIAQIASVSTDKYIVWGHFPDAETATHENPLNHLIRNKDGGMIFPRWLWNYLQTIDHLPHYIELYKGKTLQW